MSFNDNSIVIYSANELRHSGRCPELVKIVNVAFRESVKDVPSITFAPKDFVRYLSVDHMVNDVGSDPAFCMMMLSKPSETNGINGEGKPAGQRILGSICAKPMDAEHQQIFAEASEHVSSLFKRTKDAPATNGTASTAETSTPSIPKWELIASVVALDVKGKGVASHLMDLCVGEIKKRVKQDQQHNAPATNGDHPSGNHATETNGMQSELLLCISTAQEINEVYYNKRGWTTTDIKKIPAGAIGGVNDAFHVAEMEKRIAL